MDGETGTRRRRPGDFAGPLRTQREIALVNKLEEQGRFAFLVPETEPEVDQMTLADLANEPERDEPEEALRFGKNVSIAACFGRRQWGKG